MEFLQSYFNLVIIGICVVIGYAWTTFTPENDSSRRYIPVVMAVLGTILACIDARGVSLETILSGSVSGLASTGCYEAFKQLILKPKWIEEDKKSDEKTEGE